MYPDPVQLFRKYNLQRTRKSDSISSFFLVHENHILYRVYLIIFFICIPQVLDLSSNRIRSLHNNSFACCSSMKLLYLQHNSIFEIESHSFYPLSGLEVLDLSVNVISEMPYLPNTLRKLYLDDNPRLFYSNLTHPKLRIDSLTSLETLTISSNKLSGFPVFDAPVPNLIELNISKNPIDVITPEQLAPLCQLKFLYVSTEKMFSRADQNCDCLKFDWWIHKYDITMKSTVTCRKDSKSIENNSQMLPTSVDLV